MLDNDLENKWPNLIDIKRTITIPSYLGTDFIMFELSTNLPMKNWSGVNRIHVLILVALFPLISKST